MPREPPYSISHGTAELILEKKGPREKRASRKKDLGKKGPQVQAIMQQGKEVLRADLAGSARDELPTRSKNKVTSVKMCS